jgi:hypothetical protein
MAPHDATAAVAWTAGGGGAANPQELNRYAYGLNNPVKYTDPTGHCIGPVIVVCGAVAVKALFDAVVVVVGGYLIYDGVNNLATATAPVPESTPDTTPSYAPSISQGEEANTSLPIRPDEKYPRSQLPTQGTYPYVPPKQKGSPGIVKNPHGPGYVDKDGNIWVWDQRGHGGPHWDVEHPDGKHTNVYPDGEAHQGKDQRKKGNK